MVLRADLEAALEVGLRDADLEDADLEDADLDPDFAVLARAFEETDLAIMAPIEDKAEAEPAAGAAPTNDVGAGSEKSNSYSC